MTKFYEILPLKWDWNAEDDYAAASTPFGSYKVFKSDYSGWRWGYCFDEYYDEDEFCCDDRADGMKQAEANWLDRLSGCLMEVKALQHTKEPME